MTSLVDIRRRELLNQRLIGYVSWKLKRRHAHSNEVLSRIIQDLGSQQPDHIIISGDLTHLGTTHECTQARNWLDSLGKAGDVSVVPGNHDAYVATDFTHSIGQWLPYMQSDAGIEANDKAPFPYLRIREHVAIIGLSTAIPSAAFLATGKLGHAQLQRLADLLKTTAQQDLYRIVVLHHSPQPGVSSFRRRLIDAAQFISIIKHRGAELILHGHGHRQIHHRLNSNKQLPPVFGVPSASANDGNAEKTPGYNIYQIHPPDQGWSTCAQSYVMDNNSRECKMRFSRDFR